MPAFRDDDVSMTFGRFHELDVHRSHSTQVLLSHVLEFTPALLHVALQTPDETQISVRVHEDLGWFGGCCWSWVFCFVINYILIKQER
jgi:hypothetical protein